MLNIKKQLTVKILLNLLNTILEILFPKTKTQKKLDTVTAEELFLKSPKTTHPNKNILVIFDYQNNLVKQAIKSLKFNSNRRISRIFAQIIYNELLENVVELETFFNFKNPILIPIPLSKKRLRERGFNQSELILNELIKLDKQKYFTLEKNILIKIKETPPQSLTKNRKERLKNLKGSFSVKNKGKIKGKNIILFDDVTTTGATLEEAKKILLRYGAKRIICLAVAH